MELLYSSRLKNNRYLTYFFTEISKHDDCIDGLMPWDINHDKAQCFTMISANAWRTACP